MRRPVLLTLVRNVGSATVTLTVSAIDIANVDIACTGDEAIFDETCGSNAAGELGDTVNTFFDMTDCNNYDEAYTLSQQRSVNGSGTPDSLGTLGGGATRCFVAFTFLNWGTPPPQAAQSDEVSWRYQFTAQA